MKVSASGPKWLHHSEWEWARHYIAKTLDEEIRFTVMTTLQGRLLCNELVPDVINHLQATSRGIVFVTHLRNALRQHRYRALDKGRKVCTFTLPSETKRELSQRAKSLKRSESDIITTLLNDDQKLRNQDRKELKKLKEAHNKEIKEKQRLIANMRLKYDETMKQVEQQAKELATWELALKRPYSDLLVDPDTLQSEIKKKMNAINKAIKIAVTQNEELQAPQLAEPNAVNFDWADPRGL